MPTFGAVRVLWISTVLAAALLTGGVADAGKKRYQDVDWSEFIESPEDKAKWDRQAASRPKDDKAGAAAERGERRAGKGKGKKAKKAEKAAGKKAAAAARKKKNR